MDIAEHIEVADMVEASSDDCDDEYENDPGNERREKFTIFDMTLLVQGAGIF